MKKAVVLLSGGLDSATTLYIAKSRGYKVNCLVFDYGQRHRREIEAAKKIARLALCPLEVLKINFPWQGSSLLDHKMSIPWGKKISKGIPSTYVPARNTVFLSFALSCAEVAGASTIFIGANALDYSGYPDCRPGFYHAFNRLSEVATKCGLEKKPIKVETPLINLKKSEIITLGLKLGVPYKATWSCYEGGSRPCGRCDSCILREKGFSEANAEDPALSATKSMADVATK
ncbi:MAG: 7-cyano-7-deazaguanine synthase QueC [Candidatus Omnitrophica bacterium]|nr:7-cyano-7-deazaguanine synthase QueC [Candidatus Omnitrophota bacterium]